MATGPDPGDDGDGAGIVCAVVSSAAAESARRSLDAAGLLDTSLRLFRTKDAHIAIPLVTAAGVRVPSTLTCGGEELRVCRLTPPPTHRPRGTHAELRAAAAAALAQSQAGSDAVIAIASVGGVPRRWEKLGDVVLFGRQGMFEEGSAAAEALAALQPHQRDALFAALGRTLGCSRVGVQGRVEPSLHRKSGARVVWPAGGCGWTCVAERGVRYKLDVTRSMFSSGNGTEKARVAAFDCCGETVVDLYAGIGYFTLPYLVHARAHHVHACEWDEDALMALRLNLDHNGVAHRCSVHPGDNKESLHHFQAAAHRVNLGLIPSSEAGWPIAVEALRAQGGWLHVHANVGSAADEEAAWAARLLRTLESIAVCAGRRFAFSLAGIEHVKWYAPKVRHVVADVLAVPAGAPGVDATDTIKSTSSEALALGGDRVCAVPLGATNATT